MFFAKYDYIATLRANHARSVVRTHRVNQVRGNGLLRRAGVALMRRRAVLFRPPGNLLGMESLVAGLCFSVSFQLSMEELVVNVVAYPNIVLLN